MARLLLVWLSSYRAPLLASLVDVSLFTLSLFSVIYGSNIYAFTFLTLMRFSYCECTVWGRRLPTALLALLQLLVGVLVAAAAVQIAEELEAQRGLHPDTTGQLQPIRSFWTYVYWTVVTLSTVGYGEITPSTEAGKAVVVVLTIISFLWFMSNAETIAEWLRHVFNPDSQPLTSHILVLGCRSKETLKQFLDNVGPQEMTVLVEGGSWGELLQPEDSDVKIQVVDGALQPHLRRCLEHATEQNVVLIIGDCQDQYQNIDHSSNIDLEDARVVELVFRVRQVSQRCRLVAVVTRKESQEVLLYQDGWKKMDIAVCREGLSLRLLALTTAAPGAAAILANILTKPVVPYPSIQHKVSLSHLYLRSEHFTIAMTPPEKQWSQKFSFVAVYMYLTYGKLLLGYRAGHIVLCPVYLPLDDDVTLIILSCYKNIHFPEDAAIVETHYYCVRRVPVKAVVHASEDRLKAAMTATLGSLTQVEVLLDEERDNVGAVVMVSGRTDIRAALECKAQAKESYPGAIFLADAPHQEEAVTDRPHSHVTSVCPSVFAAALAAAVKSPEIYDTWLKLVMEKELVVVDVMQETTYGHLFPTLVLKEGLLPLGLTRQTTTPHLPLLNPPPTLGVAKGDVIIALSFIA